MNYKAGQKLYSVGIDGDAKIHPKNQVNVINIRGLTIFFISTLLMLSACATKQTTNEKTISSYCVEAYEDLYSGHDINSDNTSSKRSVLGGLFAVEGIFVNKAEFERLKEVCN